MAVLRDTAGVVYGSPGVPALGAVDRALTLPCFCRGIRIVAWCRLTSSFDSSPTKMRRRCRLQTYTPVCTLSNSDCPDLTLGGSPTTPAPTTSAPITGAPTTVAPTTVAPTTSIPTAIPTVSPTWSPTRHACSDGSHGCDVSQYGICTALPGNQHTCGCAHTHHCSDGDCSSAGHTCDWNTDSPTASPTSAAPTASPTPGPTAGPSPSPSAYVPPSLFCSGNEGLRHSPPLSHPARPVTCRVFFFLDFLWAMPLSSCRTGRRILWTVVVLILGMLYLRLQGPRPTRRSPTLSGPLGPT